MATLLRLLPALLTIFNLIAKWLKRRQDKQEAKEMAESAIAKEEARVSQKVAEVYVERRPDSHAADRLRNGTF